MSFEAFLTADRPVARRRRSATVGISFALHVAALIFGVATSFWHVEEMVPPSLPLQLFTFTLPAAPPPPPAARAVRRTVTRVRPRPTEIVQPQAEPVTAPEAPAESAEEQPGGEPGGVPGGVEGGTGTGPATGTQSGMFVSPNVARGQLDINPQADPYRVKLPPVLARAGMSLWALVRICVDQRGRVISVQLLKKADPAVDPLIVATLSTWRYRPYTVNGRPVPFCSNVRYEMSVPGH
jgi:protein TonB